MSKKFFVNLLLLINILLYIVLVGIWVILTDQILFNISVTVVNLCLSCLVIVMDKDRFSFIYKSEQFKKLSIHSINAILVFFILGLLNYMAFKHPLQWDLTQRKSNSLTIQTQQVLESIEQEIRFTVFARKSDFAAFRQLLELFKFKKANIEIQFVDIEVSPHLVQKFNITRPNSIAVEIGEKNIVVEEVDELHLVNALVRLGKREDPLVGIVTGHGEISWSDEGKDGLSFLKRQIQNNSYLIREISLNQISELPQGLSALIIWGPKEGFFDSELNLIKKFVNNGGKLLVALDPQIKSDKIENLRKLIKEFGIKINNDLVIDRLKNVNGSQGTVPLVEKLNIDHPVTKGISGVFFPLTSSLEPSNENVTAEVLAESMPFPASWADKNPAELLKGQVSFDEKNDTKGPLGLMMALENKMNKSRIVAFGTSNFVLNSYNRFSKNFNLFLNSLAWLVGAEELITFNLPSLRDEPVFLSGTSVNTIFYFSVVLVPILLLIVSIQFYRRRSRL
ncbi:MAG: Gldg family protein [Bdellovibrio sp.]